MKPKTILRPAPRGDRPIWYVELDAQTAGPFPVAHIRQLLDEGWIKPGALVQASDGATTTAAELCDRD